MHHMHYIIILFEQIERQHEVTNFIHDDMIVK